MMRQGLATHWSIPAHTDSLCGHTDEPVGTFHAQLSKVCGANETTSSGEQGSPLDANSRGEDLVGRWNCLS